MEPIRTLTWKTNFNHKLGNTAFIHIDAAPSVPVPVSKLDKVFEIKTADASHPPGNYLLMDVLTFRLDQLVNMITYASHGMDVYDYIQYYKREKNPEANATTLLAVYYYKKI